MPLIAGCAHCYAGSNSKPVTDLLFARSQMGMSLAFHIVFAAIGISLPVLMVTSEALYLRTGRPVFLELAKRWSRGSVILFAVGAVSGTVLSFELGLLWPSFMAKAGGIIGMLFSLEGFAFFTEAILDFPFRGVDFLRDRRRRGFRWGRLGFAGHGAARYRATSRHHQGDRSDLGGGPCLVDSR